MKQRQVKKALKKMGVEKMLLEEAVGVIAKHLQENGFGMGFIDSVDTFPFYNLNADSGVICKSGVKRA